MIELFNRLNVQPGERRLVIAVFFAFFLVLNGLWVWRFYTGSTEWNELQKDLNKAESEKADFDQEIDRLESAKAEWDKYLKDLGAAGKDMPKFDPYRRVRTLKTWRGINPVNPKRNKINEEAFFESFEKQEVRLRFKAKPRDLMLFLRELAMQQEMIRLSSFTLKPDGRERKELSGDMNIIASLPAEPKGKKN